MQVKKKVNSTSNRKKNLMNNISLNQAEKNVVKQLMKKFRTVLQNYWDWKITFYKNNFIV